jgi:hypothetical protein
MSLDVINITKNYSPKRLQSNFTNFNFINSPRPPLLIEHRQNLVRYQFPDLIIFLSCTLKCPNFEISLEHSTLVIGHGGEEEKTKGGSTHVEVEHGLSNGVEHLSGTRNLKTWPFSQ